jgi:apolipoprotein N-acyltransferase
MPLLAGGPASARRSGRGVARYNAAHLLSPGRGMRSYHKRGLVPFAERWPPLAAALLGDPPPDLASLEAGEEATVFALPDSAFGVLICFEITSASGARALAARGARFIVNLTNDAWFAGCGRPPHLPWAAVRAVETGLPVVRAANAGPSALFDRFGRTRAASRPVDGPALLTARVPASAPTLYARRGELFLCFCLVVVLAGTLAAWRSR